jgi:3'(2'), 5'-bisphosphate nucleotidase
MDTGQLWNELASDLEREFRDFRSHLRGLNVSIKPDRTILTDADIAVENLIIDRIRKVDPHPVVVAEEDERRSVRKEVLASPQRVWVIDPIDGTAEFIRPESREFCSVVCLLEDLVPVEAFIFAPELGRGSMPILITATVHEMAVRINGREMQTRGKIPGKKWASVTRSQGGAARPFEAAFEHIGYNLKTRTTSQTVDMARTALDLSSFTDPPMPQFQLFMRNKQKIWDGLAGLCLGQVAGLVSVDADGNSRLPVGLEILSQPEPTFDSTIMGTQELVTWLRQRL